MNEHDTMDAAEEVGGGNNSDDGAQEGRGHSNTWDFEEGEYLFVCFVFFPKSREKNST